MASMWRQAMLYLGLGPDEGYDDLADQQHATTPYRGVQDEPEVEIEDSLVTLVSGHDAARGPDLEVAAPAAAVAAVAAVVDLLPLGASMHIVEVGAGTGGDPRKPEDP